MRDSLTQRAYLRWRVYWDYEPWGPWRDNMHAALICREVRRPQQARGTRIELAQFMVEPPRNLLAEAENNLWNMLSLIAKKHVVPKTPE